jgi:hypothetical protein
MRQKTNSAKDQLEHPSLENSVQAKTAIRQFYRRSLTDMLAEMPTDVPRLEGWDDMQPVGLEIL